MKINRKLIKWLTVIFCITGIQTLTYFTIGLKQLKSKLVPVYLTTFKHSTDSIFVRDFYTSDCYVGDDKVYFSHNLSDDKEFIKRKFKVNYVYFDSVRNFNELDTTENKYKLTYTTWAAHYPWTTLFYFYGATQSETIHIDKKYVESRLVYYHWIFFFWIRTFEMLQSYEI